MKRSLSRLLLLALAMGAVISCDTRLPTQTRSAAPGTPPTVDLLQPANNAQINIGDSILMQAHVRGGNGLTSVSFAADKLTGDKDLGTFAQTARFAPVSVTLAAGTTDTTVRRYLKALSGGDVTLDTLVIYAIVTDSIGLKDTATVRGTMVSGPRVTIESPAANDSLASGTSVSIVAHATDIDGITQITVYVAGDSLTWPTKLNDSTTSSFDGSSRDVTFTGVFKIPFDAPQRSRITVNARALDGVKQPGTAAPITLFIRSASSIAAPRVTQVVPKRSEINDTVIVTVSGGQDITKVGLLITNSVGTVILADTVPAPTPISSNIKVGIPLRVSLAEQGQVVGVTAFAIDQGGRVGFAVRETFGGSETDPKKALVDATTVVYGQTFTMPIAGIVGDVTVDTLRGNVFLSNKSHNRLEVWSNTTRAFNPTGISVGSEPWGMTLTALSPDSLLVANSGSTNISRVCIDIVKCGAMKEDLAHRMLTRNVYLFDVSETLIPLLLITVDGPISFSDRPQYIAQSATGRVFFSTLPTSASTPGTVRWLDPSLGVAPDPRLIHNYAALAGQGRQFVIFNIDSLVATSNGLFMWDHPYGKTTGNICVRQLPPPAPLPPTDPKSICVSARDQGTGPLDPLIESMISTMAIQPGTDIEAVSHLSIASLALTDTTFVATSFDRNWIAFGEGHTGLGRVMMTADSLVGGLKDTIPQFFSPGVTVRDLTDNAAERVFGLALDRKGSMVAAHGLKAYFSAADYPFHLRLQGLFDSFDDGAGIALHPDADGQNTVPDTKRLAFVGSAGGKIEIVDVAHYNSRGTLNLKYPIYGPLRAANPMPGDNPNNICTTTPANCVVLKLFAITQRGLVVIDLRAGDIAPPP